METVSWGTIVMLELVVALTVALILAVAVCRRQRRLLATQAAALLAEREQAAPAVVAGPPAPESAAPLAATSYLDRIEEQIAATRDYHLTLSPDRDIVLDIAPEAPLERQALALRHALLIAEREAAVAANDEGDGVAWDVLVAKLSQIIQHYSQRERVSSADPHDPVQAAAFDPDNQFFDDDFPLEDLGVGEEQR